MHSVFLCFFPGSIMNGGELYLDLLCLGIGGQAAINSCELQSVSYSFNCLLYARG